MASEILTPKRIAALRPGQWARDPAPRGAGVLEVRKLTDGTPMFYARVTASDGSRERVPIGKLTLAKAREEFGKLSARYQTGATDLRATLRAERAAVRRAHELAEKEAAEAAERQAARIPLGSLLVAYCEQLKRDGRASARAVENSLRLHVERRQPKLWAKAADDVTADDVLAIVGAVADAGSKREADKVRAYLRAAFAAAINARRRADALPALRRAKLTANPARDVAPIMGGSVPGERALSLAELRAYWRRVVALPATDAALMQFHLLTGAQRVRQLARSTTADLLADEQAMRLRDGKGRRAIARVHDVPLIPAAEAAIEAMAAPERLGPYLLTVTRGVTSAAVTLAARVREVASAMAAAGELDGGIFTVRDLRRTVETRLAAEGVPTEVRAHLQSHGLGGVQARHYDRHAYAAEKRAALELLHRLATGVAATVTPIKGRRRSS